jgi:hypothetical protein
VAQRFSIFAKDGADKISPRTAKRAPLNLGTRAVEGLDLGDPDVVRTSEEHRERIRLYGESSERHSLTATGE